MICKKCGYQNAKGSQYCGGCGTRLRNEGQNGKRQTKYVAIIAVCAVVGVSVGLLISKKPELKREVEIIDTRVYTEPPTESPAELAYQSVVAHCEELAAAGNYAEIVLYLREYNSQYSEDSRYEKLLLEYEQLLKTNILSVADGYVSDGQYRLAIQTLDDAWKQYGYQEFFDAAAQCRMDFGIYNTSFFAAGKYNTILIRSNGTAEIVGDNTYRELEADGWTDITAVSAGDRHVLGLKSDGTVVSAGENDYEQREVESWRNVVAISAGDVHSVALLENGSVVATGFDDYKQCRVERLMSAAGEKRIVSISAGYIQTLALLEDGTVVACGNTSRGACDVYDWTDIVSIYTGTMYSAGLKSDGTVVVTGQDVDDWDLSGWTDIVNLAAGDYYLVGLKADGTVLSVGLDEGYIADKHKDVDSWHNIIQISAGNNHTVALNADGKVWCVGVDNYDQCSFHGTTDINKPNNGLKDQLIADVREPVNTSTNNDFSVSDIEIAINKASQFAWSWFWDAKEIDIRDSIIGEHYNTEFVFYAVTAEGINSMESLRELAHNYFTYDVVDEMMTYKGWIERDGKLYVSETFGLGGVAPDALYISVDRLKDTEYEIKVYESYNQGGSYQTLSNPVTIHYLLDDGNWVFDSILCYMGQTIPVYSMSQ